MRRSKLLLTVILFFSLSHLEAQLPVCSSNHIVYTLTADGIYNIDLSQAAPVAVLNTILPPDGAFGLAVSPNLNGASPALTFYTIVNGMYYYHNGSSWVNTNHGAGPGVNIGGGGGYIYNYDASGDVTRYDGTGDAILVATIPGFGSVADLAVDCSGNFFHLHNALPQMLTKYSPSGVIVKVYAVTGAPVSAGGGGLVVFGNDVYYDDLSSSFTFPPLLHGTITGDTINFVPAGISIKMAQDMASCPGSIVNAAPSDVSICSNQLPFTWNGRNYNAPGTYTATFSNASGCDSIATLNLAVNPAITSTIDTSICSNQLPFNWNGQPYNTQGTYTITLTAASGCDSILTLNLFIKQLPPTPLVTSPVNLCRFETAEKLSATATGNLIWYTVPSGGTGSAMTPIPPTTNAGVTNYYVSQSIAGCESPRAMIAVNVFEAPVPAADQTITVCNGNSTDLTRLYNAAGNITNWSLNQGPVIDPASVSTAGRYRFIATNASGCADTAFVNLVIQPAIIAFAGDDDVTEENMPYHLSASGGLEYKWSPGPPLLNNANIANPVAVLTATTIFSLIVKDAIGCQGYDTVVIKVVKGSDIYVPSGFTPNGDGLNDILRVLGTAIEWLDYFRIYNRYGDLIFETRDLSKGWDGTYKGKDQNTGNYVWVLKARDRKKVVRTLKGNVILIR